MVNARAAAPATITTATAMANNQVTHDYTRELLRFNAGFDRSSIAP